MVHQHAGNQMPWLKLRTAYFFNDVVYPIPLSSCTAQRGRIYWARSGMGLGGGRKQSMGVGEDIPFEGKR